jgi:hypothetical protein
MEFVDGKECWFPECECNMNVPWPQCCEEEWVPREGSDAYSQEFDPVLTSFNLMLGVAGTWAYHKMKENGHDIPP